MIMHLGHSKHSFLFLCLHCLLLLYYFWSSSLLLLLNYDTLHFVWVRDRIANSHNLLVWLIQCQHTNLKLVPQCIHLLIPYQVMILFIFYYLHIVVVSSPVSPVKDFFRWEYLVMCVIINQVRRCLVQIYHKAVPNTHAINKTNS